MPESKSGSLPDTHIDLPSVTSTKSRRRFTAEYKRRILAEADTCERGELGALLRREGLYSSYLKSWRDELSAGGESLSKTKPGPSPKKSPELIKIEKLEKENSKLRHEVSLQSDCLELQKKALSLIERMKAGSAA